MPKAQEHQILETMLKPCRKRLGCHHLLVPLLHQRTARGEPSARANQDQRDLQGWQLQRALLQTALKSRTNKGIFHEIAAQAFHLSVAASHRIHDANTQVQILRKAFRCTFAPNVFHQNGRDSSDQAAVDRPQPAHPGEEAME